jgi:hypothetical protein
MFCNGCLLQNENVSRLKVLVSCPAAKQRNRLKALLLLSVPLPRNPRAAPAKNFQKRVSRFAIANPKNQPDFQIPWHRLLLLKVLEEYGNNSFSANFDREANNSLVPMYVFAKSFMFSKRRGQKFQNLNKCFKHCRIRKRCRIYSSPAPPPPSPPSGERLAVSGGGNATGNGLARCGAAGPVQNSRTPLESAIWWAGFQHISDNNSTHFGSTRPRDFIVWRAPNGK